MSNHQFHDVAQPYLFAPAQTGSSRSSSGTRSPQMHYDIGQYPTQETGAATSSGARFDPFDDSQSLAQRHTVGRARAGTLPSSWSRLLSHPDTSRTMPARRAEESSALDAEASRESTALRSALGQPEVSAIQLRQRDQGSSAARARLVMPSVRGSLSGSVPGTPAAFDASPDFPSLITPSHGNNVSLSSRPDVHRSSLSALRQTAHGPLLDLGRASPAFGTRSRTPSNLAFASPEYASTAKQTSHLFGLDGEALRSRSGSNASQQAPSAFATSLIGPSIFSANWVEPGISNTDLDSSTSRRSSTLASSSRPGSKASFHFDYPQALGDASNSAARADEQAFDDPQDVHTLDYLGLEHDDVSASNTGRSFAPPAVQHNRNRASTLAAMPSASAEKLSADVLFRQDSKANFLFEAGSASGSAHRAQLQSPTLMEEQAIHSRDAFHAAPNAVIAGRHRAGTLAALGGPGARHRLQQELLRMVSAGNQSGMSNAEVSSLLRAHLESLGLDQHGAILEGFPHLDLHTPPPLSTRQSPRPTQPPTPTMRRSHSKSSFDDVSHPLAAMHLGQVASAHAPSGTSVLSSGHHLSRDASQRSAASTSTHQPPSRSLWIGNLSSATTGQELMHVFAPYGAIESLRLLPEKECGFVNFVEMSDAIRAREDVLNRLGARLENLGTGPGGRVRIGFGKLDTISSATPIPSMASHANPSSAQSEAHMLNSAQGNPFESIASGLVDEGKESEAEDNVLPTRALWVGSIPSNATSNTLLSVFQPFGPIESARVLSHKNCGFINFERVDDAVRARKMLNGRDVLGTEVGAMRIGFAKVPIRNLETLPSANLDLQGASEESAKLHAVQDTRSAADNQAGGYSENRHSNLVVSLLNRQAQKELNTLSQDRPRPLESEQAVVPSGAARSTGVSASSSIVPASDKGGVPLPAYMAPQESINDLQLLMSELSDGEADQQHDVAVVGIARPSSTYYMTLPLVTEVSSGRRFETSRLRDARRSIESGQLSKTKCDDLAIDYLDSIVDLASDYIGNTLVQKFFEACSEHVKLEMLYRLAPHLAVVGCHKNGTWAAQKILDSADTPEQISLIAQNLRPYIPGLLLNEFGNYVVQCCLPWREYTDFVFDAMIDRCWEIAQGRYGARSMRACLESPHTSHLQRKRVAMAIVLNSVPLATSSNGALLLSWLLDSSGLTRSYRLLAPRLAPHLAHLCTHKVASPTVLRLVTQTVEHEASDTILRALFEPPMLERDGADSTMSTTLVRPSQVLEDIVTDQVHGSQFIAKVLASPTLTPAQRERYSPQVKTILEKHNLSGVPAYRRLCEDLGMVQPSYVPPFAMPPGHAMRPPNRPQALPHAPSAAGAGDGVSGTSPMQAYPLTGTTHNISGYTGSNFAPSRPYAAAGPYNASTAGKIGMMSNPLVATQHSPPQFVAGPEGGPHFSLPYNGPYNGPGPTSMPPAHSSSRAHGNGTSTATNPHDPARPSL